MTLYGLGSMLGLDIYGLTCDGHRRADICGGGRLGRFRRALARIVESPGPLTEVNALAEPAITPWVFTLMTLFAVANTVLVNCVTSSRLVYGIA